MEQKFNLGDVVVMIADGPKMAVEGYVVNEDTTTGEYIESDEYVNVVYFSSDTFKRDSFHQDLLVYIGQV